MSFLLNHYSFGVVAGPVFTTPPVLTVASGSGYVGSTLSWTVGTASAGTPTAALYGDGLPIIGATSPYLVPIGYNGAEFHVVATVTSGGVSNTAPSNSIHLWVPQDLDAIAADIRMSQSGVSLLGSLVTGWDSHTGGTATQGLTTSCPAYSATSFGGFPGITFDGTDDFLVTTRNTAGQAKRCVIIVGSIAASKINGFYSGDSIGQYYLSTNSDAMAKIWVTAANSTQVAISSAAIPLGTNFVIVAETELGGTYSFRYNGASKGTGSTTTAAFAASGGPMRIGGAAGGYLNGTLAAVIDCSDFPSAGDIEKIEGWAAHQFPGAIALDGAHPYLSSPPTV